MARLRSDGIDTRRRLLEAAARVFARQGYWEATNAQICQRAGANTAAVNYHFRSKEALYVEAWHHAFRESALAHPPDGGVSPGAPAEARLRGRILALARRATDPASHDFDILRREMANPTGLLVEAQRLAIAPLRRGLEDLIRELLGARATEQRVRFCRMSVIAQCLGPILRRRQRHGAAPRAAPRPALDNESFANHVFRFSLAGIRAVAAEPLLRPAPRADRVPEERKP